MITKMASSCIKNEIQTYYINIGIDFGAAEPCLDLGICKNLGGMIYQINSEIYWVGNCLSWVPIYPVQRPLNWELNSNILEICIISSSNV